VTVVPAWVGQAVVSGQALSAGLEELRAAVRATDKPSPAKKQARTKLHGEVRRVRIKLHGEVRRIWTKLHGEVRRIRTELDDARKAAREVLEGIAKGAPGRTKAAAIKVLVTARTTLQAFDKTKPRKVE
jgi:hypothetical protein